MKKYDSYKDSGVEWIGEIPTNWKSKRFSYSIDIQKGKIPKKLTDEKLIDSLPYLSMGVLRGDKPMEFSNESGIVHVSKGDIGLLWDGSNSGEVIRINREGILSSTVSLLSLKDDFIDKEFCFYLLKFYENDFRENTIGMGIPHVSGDHVRESKLIIPTLSEQKQIVSFLDTKTSLIDSLIDKTKRKVELLKEKRTSLINEVVTKGLNPNVEMKDSGVEWIGEIPSHWEKIKLHTLVTSQKLEFQDGNHGGLHPIPDEFLETGVPFIKPKDIQKEKVLWDSCDRLPFERCEQFRIGFSNNDDVLLVNRGGSIGKVVYVSDYDNEFSYFVINPQVTYMRGKNGLLSKYLFYVSVSDIFQCGIDLIMGHGSTFPFLGLSNMGDFEVVIPPVKEQEQIVEYLDEQIQLIDKTISIEEKRIELLKEYRQSLISEVVTGKRKVI